MEEKEKKFSKVFWPEFFRAFVLVAGFSLFAFSFSAFADEGLFKLINTKIAPFFQIIIAEIVGFLAPGPRYWIYPVLRVLAKSGVEAAVIIALIGGHVLIEPATSILEAGYFGWRFPLKRFIASFIVIYILGVLTLLLTNYGLTLL